MPYEPEADAKEIAENIRWHRLLIYGLGCVLLLILISGGLNWAYYSFSDSDNFINVHNVSVEDTTTDADAINATINKTVHTRGTATVDVTLVRIRSDGTRQVVETWTRKPYLEQGTHIRFVRYPVKNGTRLPTGQYYLHLTIRVELPEDVTRTVSAQSDTFNVTRADATA